MNASGMAGIVPEWLPGGGQFWVYLTGVAHVLAAIALIINRKASLAALLLAVMLLIFALTIHLPGAMDGDQSSTSAFLKDLGMAAGALFMSDYLSD